MATDLVLIMVIVAHGIRCLNRDIWFLREGE